MLELIVSLSIMAVIALLTGSYYYFGTTSFNEGKKKAISQRNARTVGNYINDQIRNAINIEFIPIANSFTTAGFKGFGIQGGKFLGISTDTPTVMIPNIDSISNVNFRLIDKAGNGNLTLNYIVTGTSGDEQYLFESDVFLLNSKSGSFVTNGVLETDYNLAAYKVYYQLPP